VGVLSGKLKVLDRAYDELKLLKRGCKILDKAPLTTVSRASFTTTAAAASGGVPCGEHSVPGLPRAASMISNGPGDCAVCAQRIRDSLGDGEIIRFSPPGGFFGNYREQDTYNWNNGYHAVVVLNGRVYDAFTPKGGELIADYKAHWDYGDIIDFGF